MRSAQWDAQRERHEASARREMTASLEAGIVGNPSYSTVERGDDPVLRHPVLATPQSGHLPVITDRSTSWRSPAEIAACRWPDHMPLTDLISHRIISPPCSEQDFAMRLKAAGQSERACQLRAFEAQEAGWFTMPVTAVHLPSEAQLAHELDKLVCPSWTPRDPHTGNHEPTMSPAGSQPSYHTGLGQTYGVRPEGVVINARAQRAKPRHNYHYVCAELMRLYYRGYELAL